MEKIPLPCDMRAEKIVLGACLTNFDDLNEAIPVLIAEDFGIKEHAEIYISILSLCETDIAPNVDTVFERLKRTNSVIKLEYLVDLAVAAPRSYYIQDFIADLKRETIKRRLLKIGEEILFEVPNTKMDPLELIRKYEEALFKAAEQPTTSRPQKIKEVMNSEEPVLKEIQTLQERKNAGQQVMPGMPTHFVDLDKKIPGLCPGHLLLVGARPRVGKTTFVLNLVRSICFKNNEACLFFSLEMTKREIAFKSLSLQSEVGYQKILRGEISGQEFQKINVAEKAWSDKCFIIDDQAGLAIDQIRSRCYRAMRKDPIKAVFIDYLQLLTSKGRFESRHLEVGDISRKLKSLAKDLKIPIVALCQLNREMEKRTGENRRPQLSDLRESGSLEADADEVILLHRPELDDPKKSAGIIQLFIEKNRFGETGIVELLFKKETGEMQNYLKRYDEPADESIWKGFSP